MVLEVVAFTLSLLAGPVLSIPSVLSHENANSTIVSPVTKEVLADQIFPSETPTPSPTPTPVPTETPSPLPTEAPITTPTSQPVFAPGELEILLSKYADEYRVDKELLKRIAACESGFNTGSKSGIYAGMFQFAEGTWLAARTRMGQDSNLKLRTNAEESVKTAAFMVESGQQEAWHNCLK